MEKFRFLPKSKISQLPKTPGVYAFKKGKDFLYLGKARNIKERIKNHFQQPNYRDNLFIDKVNKIGYIKQDSEIEALILEAKLIKKYQPKHNVAWRDDKNYFYICISKEKFPRIYITHQVDRGEASFIGPFVDGKALKETLRILRKVFPYRTCKKLPKKPCLWYQLNRCPAPCLCQSKLAKEIGQGFISTIQRRCQRNVRNLIKILQGRKKQALIDLKKEMKKLSKEEKFEEANKIKYQIQALEKVMSHAHIFDMFEVKPQTIMGRLYQRIEAYDISNIQGKEATGAMVSFIHGQPEKNFYRRFKIKLTKKPNDIAMIKEVLLRRLKHQEWPYPDLILIDGGKAQLNAAQEICSKLKLNQIKVMALAKKKNELYVQDRKKPILLKKLPRETFNLVLQLRDEAHRFARSYHLKLRKKSLLQ